jgi:hypothetical protein
MAAAPQLIASINGLEIWRKGDAITLNQFTDARSESRRRHVADLTMSIIQWRHLVREAGDQ